MEPEQPQDVAEPGEEQVNWMAEVQNMVHTECHKQRKNAERRRRTQKVTEEVVMENS